MTTKRQLKRINLAEASVTELSIRASYRRSDEHIAHLHDVIGLQQQSGPSTFVSISTYTPRRGKTRPRHFILGSVMAGGPEEDFILLALTISTYSPYPYERPSRKLSQESKLLEFRERMGEPLSMSASVEFVFTEVNSNSLWFPLPTQLASRDDTAVYEIRGVRAARLTDAGSDDEEYTFTLDRPFGDDVFLDVRFVMDNHLRLDSPGDVLNRAATIARTLMSG